MDAIPDAAVAAIPTPIPTAAPVTVPTVLPIDTIAPPSPSSSGDLIATSSPKRIHSGGVPAPPPRHASVVNAAKGITASAVNRSKNEASGTLPICKKSSMNDCSRCNVFETSAPTHERTITLANLPINHKTRTGANHDNLVIEINHLRVNAAIVMCFLANFGKTLITSTSTIR